MAEFFNEYGALLWGGHAGNLIYDAVCHAVCICAGPAHGRTAHSDEGGRGGPCAAFQRGVRMAGEPSAQPAVHHFDVFIIPFTRLLVVRPSAPRQRWCRSRFRRPVHCAHGGQSLEEIDTGVIEAAQCMGATRWQIVTRVLLVESVPSLLRGLSISLITILGYTAITGSVGAGGLGNLAFRFGYQRYQKPVMYATVLLLILLVCVIQIILILPPAKRTSARAEQGASGFGKHAVCGGLRYIGKTVEGRKFVMKKFFGIGIGAGTGAEPGGLLRRRRLSDRHPGGRHQRRPRLLLLRDLGILTLKEGVGLEATEQDIVENPQCHHQGDGRRQTCPPACRMDFAVINGNYASGAGIGDKVLTTEDAESVAAQTYGNVVAVKEGRENDPAVQALVAVLMSRDVQAWIEGESYNGVVMPMGAQELDIPEIAEPVTLKVGASPSPHAEILEHVKPLLAEHNVELDIVEFDDYVMPNTGVEDGSLDANYFQHQPYLNDFNAEQSTHIVSVATVHYEPMGIYPGKTASLDVFGK